MGAFHQGFNVLITHIANQLSYDRNTTAAADSFEASSILYDTGLRQQRTLLCQQRSGAIGGSVNRTEIYCADFAFEVCLGTMENLQTSVSRRGLTPKSVSQAPTQYTSLYWKWTELLLVREEPKGGGWWSSRAARLEERLPLGKPRAGTLQLTSMKDVIIALIPFVMLCGSFPSQMHGLVNMVHAISNPSVPTMTCEEVRFLAFFVVRTSKSGPWPIVHYLREEWWH